MRDMLVGSMQYSESLSTGVHGVEIKSLGMVEDAKKQKK